MVALIKSRDYMGSRIDFLTLMLSLRDERRPSKTEADTWALFLDRVARSQSLRYGNMRTP